MNDIPQDAWFYSMEGERLGPVTFSELQLKALDGKLNPRLDMAWTKGMQDWKPAGEIEGLFERRVAPEFVMQEPATDPYRALPEDPDEEDPMGKKESWPGARRRSFLFMALVFPGLWLALVGMSTNALTGVLGAEIMEIAVPVLMTLPGMFLLYFTVRRFVNLGMSGWWIFGSIVPFLNLWLGYRCFACPSGYAYSKKLDGVGIFLAILYWLLITLLLLAVTVTLAILAGSVGTPEVQEQFREQLHQAMEPTTP